MSIFITQHIQDHTKYYLLQEIRPVPLRLFVILVETTLKKSFQFSKWKACFVRVRLPVIATAIATLCCLIIFNELLCFNCPSGAISDAASLQNVLKTPSSHLGAFLSDRLGPDSHRGHIYSTLTEINTVDTAFCHYIIFHWSLFALKHLTSLLKYEHPCCPSLSCGFVIRNM